MRRGHANAISITGHRDHRYLTVTIDDDGPGIPLQMREEVFKPFLRLDDARNQDEGGTGLGPGDRPATIARHRTAATSISATVRRAAFAPAVRIPGVAARSMINHVGADAAVAATCAAALPLPLAGRAGVGAPPHNRCQRSEERFPPTRRALASATAEAQLRRSYEGRPPMAAYAPPQAGEVDRGDRLVQYFVRQRADQLAPYGTQRHAKENVNRHIAHPPQGISTTLP